MIRFDSINHVVCFGAHCDDIEIGCLGALMRIIEERPNVRVDWVVFSGNEARREEAHQSASHVLKNVEHKMIVTEPFTDTYFPEEFGKIKRFLHGKFENVQPDLVFTHYAKDAHQDHRIVSQLTPNVFRGGLVLEYEVPKYDADLGQPNVYVNISADILEEKKRVIDEFFPSQKGRYWNQPEVFESIARIRGLESKSPSCFAEAFHCRKMIV